MGPAARALGLLTLLLCALAGNARAADSCSQAKELIDTAQTRPLRNGLESAQQAVKLCDSYDSELFLAHVQGALGKWEDAESAYQEARAFAGGNAEQVSQVDMERALLTAAEPGRTCDAVAAFDEADAERTDRDLGPAPAWFIERRRAVEGAWSRDGLPADEIRCALSARRSMVTRAIKNVSVKSEAQRRFCSEMTVSVPVPFDTNTAQLSADGRRQVVALAEAVRPLLGDDRLRLDGHADERGPEAHNQVLSEQRAATVGGQVRTLLGIEQQRMQAVGHGSKQPKYPGHTEEDYRLNRRVELTLVPATCPL
jgi:outer membrane protein OmpA-like peptidoglycan-associated protein